MALASNAAFGMLNRGTTTPAPAPSTAAGTGGFSISDILGPGNSTGGYTVPGFSTDATGNIINQDGSTRAGGLFPGGLNFGGAPVNPATAPTILPPGSINTGTGAPPATNPSTSGGRDLAGLVNSFPGVSNALALEQMGIGQLDAALNQARQQAIINFGDPALAQMAGFGIDPQAGAFAQQNYLSGNATLARLDKQHQLAQQAVVNQLAAHGILNSGDLGYREGVENQTYGNNVYDAQQSVLQHLADLYTNYLNSRYGLERDANSAQLSALQSFLANPDAYTMLFGGGGNAQQQGLPPGESLADWQHSLETNQDLANWKPPSFAAPARIGLTPAQANPIYAHSPGLNRTAARRFIAAIPGSLGGLAA